MIGVKLTTIAEWGSDRIGGMYGRIPRAERCNFQTGQLFGLPIIIQMKCNK